MILSLSRDYSPLLMRLQGDARSDEQRRTPSQMTVSPSKDFKGCQNFSGPHHGNWVEEFRPLKIQELLTGLESVGFENIPDSST